MAELKRHLAALGAFVLACVLPRLPRQVDCDAVFKRAFEEMRPVLDAAGASVHGGSLPAVRVDPRLLACVFRTLLGNAARHPGEEPPIIHVSARPAGREWLFAVHDNGPGIDPADHRAIFSVFSGARELPGCHQIVRRHGGRMWVESTLGEGATFCFTIPATRDLELVD